jgi:hypothetical protein
LEEKRRIWLLWATVFPILGALVVAGSFTVYWYNISATGPGIVGTEGIYYESSDIQWGLMTAACQGNLPCTAGGWASSAVQSMYNCMAALSVLSLLLGLLAAIGAIRQRSGAAPIRFLHPSLLATTATLVELAVPVALGLLQPWVLGRSLGASEASGDTCFSIGGATQSFLGSCVSNVDQSMSIWGPTEGWFMAIFAGIFLLGGALVLYLNRKPIPATT